MKQQQFGFVAAAAKSEEPQQSKRKSLPHDSTTNSYAECYPGYVCACMCVCLCVCVRARVCVPHVYELVTQCIAYSALEELDATYVSDNEADYTKMDMVRVCRKKL